MVIFDIGSGVGGSCLRKNYAVGVSSIDEAEVTFLNLAANDDNARKTVHNLIASTSKNHLLHIGKFYVLLPTCMHHLMILAFNATLILAHKMSVIVICDRTITKHTTINFLNKTIYSPITSIITLKVKHPR